MDDKKKKPFSSRFSKFEDNNNYMDFDSYDDLVEEGFKDTEIAKEFNIDVEFLKRMKKEMNEEY